MTKIVIDRKMVKNIQDIFDKRYSHYGYNPFTQQTLLDDIAKDMRLKDVTQVKVVGESIYDSKSYELNITYSLMSFIAHNHIVESIEFVNCSISERALESLALTLIDSPIRALKFVGTNVSTIQFSKAIEILGDSSTFAYLSILNGLTPGYSSFFINAYENIIKKLSSLAGGKIIFKIGDDRDIDDLTEFNQALKKYTDELNAKNIEYRDERFALILTSDLTRGSETYDKKDIVKIVGEYVSDSCFVELDLE